METTYSTTSIEYDSETSYDSSGSEEENERCFPEINKNLIYCKLFYFFYHSAMGSLWPYLPLYFRQLFLTPRQVGAIVACRTFVQFLFVPFWCAIAEKYRRHKELLLLSLFSWLFSTMGILLVPKEQPRACLSMLNKGLHTSEISPLWFDFTPLKQGVNFDRESREMKTKRQYVSYTHSTPPTQQNMTYDVDVIYSEYDPEKHLSDTSTPFILLLAITIIGVSLASPAQSLADICTLKVLKTQNQTFGQQVLWAAVGSAMFAFTMGVFVSFIKRDNPCTKLNDINYDPCFYGFAFFMILTLFVATRFAYGTESTPSVDLDETIASFWECVKTINDVHLASLLVVTFSCGFGNGFISTFLFWHLREMGGLQFLLALVSLINSTAEVLFYILSDRLMGYVGHFKLIYLGLLFFSARFFYYSFLRQPWLVLPIEVTHGMTSAAIRSSMISYIRQEGATVNILHGLFNGIHGGLGFSIGGLVGGFMVHSYGHSITFLIFGEISLLTLFLFILINNVWPFTKHDMKENLDISPKTKLTDLFNAFDDTKSTIASRFSRSQSKTLEEMNIKVDSSSQTSDEFSPCELHNHTNSK